MSWQQSNIKEVNIKHISGFHCFFKVKPYLYVDHSVDLLLTDNTDVEIKLKTFTYICTILLLYLMPFKIKNKYLNAENKNIMMLLTYTQRKHKRLCVLKQSWWIHIIELVTSRYMRISIFSNYFQILIYNYWSVQEAFLVFPTICINHGCCRPGWSDLSSCWFCKINCLLKWLLCNEYWQFVKRKKKKDFKD